MTKILLVTGPSGAGKTTICTEFLKQVTGVWAYVDQDDVRQLVKAGYASVDDHEKTWSDETRRQWEVSIPICVDIAKRYRDVGINCLIDFFGPTEELENWKKFLGDTPYTLVLLQPDEQATVEHNAGRSAPARLKESKIRRNYHRFDTWQEAGAMVIDTSEVSLADAVTQLISLVDVEDS